MTTERQAELASRRQYERREQMAQQVEAALVAAYGTPSVPLDRVAALRILDAILPQVSTVAELEALPYRSVLVGTDGWVTRWMAGRDAEYILADAPTLPLTVVWQPEVTA